MKRATCYVTMKTGELKVVHRGYEEVKSSLHKKILVISFLALAIGAVAWAVISGIPYYYERPRERPANHSNYERSWSEQSTHAISSSSILPPSFQTLFYQL
ncbi:MAG: hypothetical protein N3F04_07380 [Candidatus Nezhaarchaeota archaeon]|nr:hypothetical protein [Candidatus Nezhaarchaeota archaeon]MCX8142566.1 hypothetical protein [Candidatus Nezhaarchaeota archaeon]